MAIISTTYCLFNVIIITIVINIMYIHLFKVSSEKGSVTFGAWHHCTQTCIYVNISIFDIVEFSSQNV